MTTATERWDVRALPPRERMEGFRAALAATHVAFDPRPPTGPAARFEAVFARRRFGELSLVDCVCDPCAGARGRRELAADPGWAGVLVVVSGRERVRQGATDLLLGPGDCVVWDGDRPVGFEVLEPLRKRTLMLPRERVLGLGGEFPAHIRADSSAGRLLRGYLAALGQELGDLDGAGRIAAANAALELLRAALAPTVGAGLREALLPVVRRWIEARLQDAALAPPAIAAAHAISLRTLHALFEPTGESVGAFVRRRRLERARAELLERPELSVTTVALRWGFRDPAHFSRAFRGAFAQSPRDARNAKDTRAHDQDTSSAAA